MKPLPPPCVAKSDQSFFRVGERIEARIKATVADCRHGAFRPVAATNGSKLAGSSGIATAACFTFLLAGVIPSRGRGIPPQVGAD